MAGPGCHGHSVSSRGVVSLCPALALSNALEKSPSLHTLEQVEGQSIGNYRQDRSRRNAIILSSQFINRLVKRSLTSVTK